MFEDGTDELNEADEELQISSLIDVVFLLLIYFIVTMTLKLPESDIGIQLPGTVKQSKEVKMPAEQIIDLDAEGRVFLNNEQFGAEGSRDLPRLVETLRKYKQASDSQNTKALVTIQATADTLHQRVVDVMNACQAAGLKHMTFGMGD
jgi:biopolymer transport protein ExbD